MPATFEGDVFTDSSGKVISVAHGTDLKFAGTTSHGHRGDISDVFGTRSAVHDWIAWA